MSRNTSKRPSKEVVNKTGPGTAKLRKALDRKLGAKCNTIAKSLVDKACKGHETTAKLVVALAEGADWREDSASTKRLASIAEALAADQEWKDEADEKDAETGSGGHEREG